MSVITLTPGLQPASPQATSWLRRLFPAWFDWAGPQAQATRVGLLNTGELVLLDATGHAQVLSPATVATIRATLATAPRPDAASSPEVRA